jgi:hypothetical protein
MVPPELKILSGFPDLLAADGRCRSIANGAWAPMPKEDPEKRPYSWDPEQVQEFRSFLQIDDIAPVDAATYGKRFSEIIQRATTVSPKKVLARR